MLFLLKQDHPHLYLIRDNFDTRLHQLILSLSIEITQTKVLHFGMICNHLRSLDVLVVTILLQVSLIIVDDGSAYFLPVELKELNAFGADIHSSWSDS